MGYRIKTVSDITGIQRATLLAWERRFRLVAPTRHANGYREYSDSDLARLLSLASRDTECRTWRSFP